MSTRQATSDLWKKEDWLAIWIGFIVIAVAIFAVLSKAFDFNALKFSTWTVGEAASKAVPLGKQLASGAFWGRALVTVLTLGILFSAGVKLQGEKLKDYVPAFIGLFVVVYCTYDH